MQRIIVHVESAHGPHTALAYTARRWNGWLMPWFTTSTGQLIARETSALADEYGIQEVERVIYRPESDTFVTVRFDGEEREEFEVPVITIDGTRYHAIGAASWCWERFTS